MRTRAVRGEAEGRARWPKARRSSGSAIAAEAFMSNVGWGKVPDGRQGSKRSSNALIFFHRRLFHPQTAKPSCPKTSAFSYPCLRPSCSWLVRHTSASRLSI